MIIKEEESYNLETEFEKMEARIMSQVCARIDKIQGDLHEAQNERQRTREELRKTQEGLTEQQHKNATLEVTVTNINASQCRSDLIDEYQKWVVALQDINDMFQLEQAVPYLVRQYSCGCGRSS